MSMELLSRTEESLLLAVYELGNNAYGLTIRKHIEDLYGKKFSIGAIYVPLDRLTKNGLLSSFETEPTTERGGRRKRMYRITERGISALQEARSFHEKIWANASALNNSKPQAV